MFFKNKLFVNNISVKDCTHNQMDTIEKATDILLIEPFLLFVDINLLKPQCLASLRIKGLIQFK
jgi:hypothetical protein